MKTRIQALAVYWGCDVSDVKDCRYQSTRTSIPVFTSGENFYCATKGNEKPATHNDGSQWNWTEQQDSFVNKYGWKIWKS